MTKKETKKIDITQYNFGEKKSEKWKNSKTYQWEDLEVWQTPKYIQSKKKAIELIEDGKYFLDEGDFWILKNKGGSKLCYTGLIISHNGCLKINDQLESDLKFKPSCVSFVKDEAEKVKVMQYINEDQGVYEFGEISPKNCNNDYPYAMVLKRLMDRVILKNSKVGFFGIYSDSESEDFKEKLDDQESKTDAQKLGQIADEELKDTYRKSNEDNFVGLKAMIESCASLEELQSVWTAKENVTQISSLKKYADDLYQLLIECKDAMKGQLND